MSETFHDPQPRHRIETVWPGNRPTIRAQRYAALVISGASLANAGNITAILSADLVIPISLPGSGSTLDRVIPIYQGIMPVEISEFTLTGAPLATGTITLIAAGE